MNRLLKKLMRMLLVALSGWLSVEFVSAEEIWLHDNTRVYGLVQRVENGKLAVFRPTGKEELYPLEDIVSIRFLGRTPLLIQSGTQEFRFINGGTMRGQVSNSTHRCWGLLTLISSTSKVLFHCRWLRSAA
jgi:hypothetical protein